MLILLLLPAVAHAQSTRPSQASLITFGPGQEIFEKFAHNAIWLHNPQERPPYNDVAFNYGLFTFGGDFLYRFVFGTMHYWMGGQDAAEMLQIYRDDNRDTWVQQLDLSPQQFDRLSAFLWNNARPENKFYDYNYYIDNCSTRVRDALDGALDGAIRAQTANIPSGHSYRFHTQRIMAENPFLYICVDALMGQRTDREISRWEEMFLPQLMQVSIRDVTNPATNRPLVLSESVLFRGTRAAVLPSPPDWRLRFFLLGAAMAGLMLLLHFVRARRSAIILAGGWLLFAGISGAVLAFFWFCTDHWATTRNENLLQLSPLALAAFIMLVVPRWRRFAGPLTLIVAGGCVLGVALKATPLFFQGNWNIVLWVLPVNLATAMIVATGGRKVRGKE